MRPTQADHAIQKAGRHLQAGDLGSAEGICRDLVHNQPNHAEGWALLGMVLSGQGRHAEAVSAFERAAALRPGPPAWNNLAEAQRGAGNLPRALELCDQALGAAADFPEAHFNRGNVLKALGRFDEAVAAYRRAVALRPAYFKALYNLGNALREIGQVRSAIAVYRQALAARPDSIDVLVNLGNALKDWKELDEALACFRRALTLSPGRADLHASVGIVLAAQGKRDEARASFEREAINTPATWWKPLRSAGLLAPVANDNAEIDAMRAGLAEALQRLYPARGLLPLAELHSSGIEPPMLLAYHGRDDRPLREAYYALLGDMLPAQRPPAGTGRPHVGIVVTHGHEGVFWKCLGPLVDRLPADDLRVSVVCGRAGAGVLRQWFSNPAIEFLPLPERLNEAVALLKSARLDLLHYWEVGTDSMNYFLPYLRPAPLQSATWGWPVTTGNPRIDFFISSALLEPEGAEVHYTEQLIRLPSLPTCYRRPALPSAAGRAERGERLYLCTQNLRKFHPDFDALVAGVLRADPGGVFVLLGEPGHPITTQLLTRLRKSMPDVFGRVRELPRMPEADYLALVARAAVVLDTPHYGGGANTLFDTLTAGTPFVTLPGSFQRSRFGLAVCQLLGLDQFAVGSPEEYIRRAVELAHATDAAARQRLRVAAEGLFEDDRPVRELRAFFLEAIHHQRGTAMP